MKTNYYDAIHAITKRAKNAIIAHVKENGEQIAENIYRLDVSENEIYCLEYLGYDGDYQEYHTDALIVDHGSLEFECNRVRVTDETYLESACINNILCGLE